MRATLVLLFAVLVAGCASPAAERTGDPEGTDASAIGAFTRIDPGLRCEGDCFEPTVAVDPEGRLFVVEGGMPVVRVSRDGGATWSETPAPAFPARLASRVGDVLVQVGTDGSLYYSALVLREHPAGGFVLEGIQVARSDDGGATWAEDAYLSPADTVGAAVVYPDRQWLGFAPDGTVYLTYNQIPSGIWVARSDDRGATWGGWTRAASLEDRRGVGQSGPPVIDAEGLLHVPACTLVPAGLAVYSSSDGGATFVRSDVPTGTCSWFPILATSPDGRLLAAWTGTDASLHVSARGPDGGWSDPVQWADASVTSPWPLAREDGTVDVAWIGGDDVSLRVSTGAPDAAPTSERVVVEGLREDGASHYAHAARLGDGRLALTWADGDAVVLAMG